MANQLKVAMQQKIITLHDLGWSFRKIARELGINRETVSRHVRLAREGPKPAISTSGSEPPGTSKPAISTPGSEPTGPSKPAISTPGSAGRQSKCEPYRQVIEEMLEMGLSAQRIWQDLTFEHGFDGSNSSVKRFVRHLIKVSPLPFRRMECDPGEEGQIDFGKGAFVRGRNGRRKRTHVLRVVLSHSRKAYSETVSRQTTEHFIRCLENAFLHFGGVPATLVPDNLRAAVKDADWFDPEINPKVEAFAEHYGTVFLPTKPYTPRHKGKVERGIDYVQDNALKGRTFESIEAQNRHLWEWESKVADTRIHGTTRKQVGKVFEEVERAYLKPLPAARFPFFREGERTVHRDGHVEVDKTYYSVPPEYLGRRVLVRWDSRLVRVFIRRRDESLEQIALHSRREPGQFSTDPRHIASEKISKVEKGAEWLLRKVGLVGPQALGWSRAMLEKRGVAGIRVLAGLLSLTGKHSAGEIDQACGIAFGHGAFRLRHLRETIKRQTPPQEQFDFMEHHPIIRDITDYGQLDSVRFTASGAEIVPYRPIGKESEK